MNKPLPPPESHTPETLPPGVDPVEIAMEAERHDASPDSPARTVLVRHARLLDQQIIIARLTKLRERVNAARDLAIVLLLGLVVFGVIGAVWSASRAQGIVISPFSTPPDMAARGITGEVVANHLLDEINAMQEASRSARRLRYARRESSDDLRVEIPQTGVSWGELWRVLRQRFGRETMVSGDVRRLVDGQISVTIRLEGVSAAFQGPERDLDALIRASAERVFARTEPFVYGAWLATVGRDAESLEAYRRLAESNAPAVERAWGYGGMSLRLRERGDMRASVEMARASIRMDRTVWGGWGNLSTSSRLLGHDEVYLQARAQAVRILRQTHNDQDPDWGRYRAAYYRAGELAARADMMGAAAAHRRAAELAIGDTPGRRAHTALEAESLALVHDLSGSMNAWTSPSVADDSHPIMDYRIAEIARRVEAQDWAGVERVALAPLPSGRFPGQRATYARVLTTPWLAYAHARQGRIADAQQLIATTPADCYLCVRMRARIAALAGDAADADRWFAEAVRQGPSLPFAYSEWGQELAARGDFVGAIRRYREAQRRGPRWADPLKFEGDALAAQGNNRAALRRYEAAAERAPRWGALHVAWGRALEVLGQRNQALAKYRAALSRDLSAEDRAEAERRAS